MLKAVVEPADGYLRGESPPLTVVVTKETAQTITPVPKGFEPGRSLIAGLILLVGAVLGLGVAVLFRRRNAGPT
ncbi:MAG: hypothetical protein P3X22_007090 [Thermoprotei archaeon]|nr:hypothetical protein [Thermoprotei archaeon]